VTAKSPNAVRLLMLLFPLAVVRRLPTEPANLLRSTADPQPQQPWLESREVYDES
jgi:hypothetical protein